MDMTAAYREVGTYRGAAEICGTTPKSVKRAVAADEREDLVSDRGHSYHAVADVVAQRVERTKAKITARRLLPLARAEGYGVSRGICGKPPRDGAAPTLTGTPLTGALALTS